MKTTSEILSEDVKMLERMSGGNPQLLRILRLAFFLGARDACLTGIDSGGDITALIKLGKIANDEVGRIAFPSFQAN